MSNRWLVWDPRYDRKLEEKLVLADTAQEAAEKFGLLSIRDKWLSADEWTKFYVTHEEFRHVYLFETRRIEEGRLGAIVREVLSEL